MTIAEQLKQRIENEAWQPVTIANDRFQLDLPEVHGMDEVGFIFWRKVDDGGLVLIASGHTLRGQLVDAKEQPLDLAADVQDELETLLDQED
ncbi:MAG TPA: hypothetical protein VHV31_12665 [Nitrolancea sp.]|jgi:hypothetical protein|nr:hypothetical protein [Nitrolancea sp.]